MKTKNIYRLLVALMGWVFLSSLSFSDIPTSLPTDACDRCSILKAVQGLKNDIYNVLVVGDTTNKLASSNADLAGRINTSLDRLFALPASVTTTPATPGQSILDQKIDNYIKNFYNLYVTTAVNITNFAEGEKQNGTAIDNSLSKFIGYNLQTSGEQKSNDLLAQMTVFDSGNNNNTAQTSSSGDPLGGLSDKAPSADNIPNISDITLADTYTTPQQQQKAKLAISALINRVKQAPYFAIPPKSGSSVTVNFPYPESDGTFKTVSVSTSKIKNSSDNTPEYDLMVNYLNNNNIYTDYKRKVMASNTLFSLCIEPLLRAYYERMQAPSKDGKTQNPSIKEREKQAVFAGLKKDYYDNLKKASIADLQVQALQASQMTNYLLYKLREDINRLTLIMAAGAMQLAGPDMSDDRDYIKPIGVMFDKQCWNPDNNGTDACKDPKAYANQQSSAGGSGNNAASKLTDSKNQVK